MIQRTTDTKFSALLLCTALVALYAATPLAVMAVAGGDVYMTLLFAMCLVACASIMIGFHLPALDSRFNAGARRLAIRAGSLQRCIWWGLVAFAALAFLTADDIPLLTALSGHGAHEVSRSRGAFLKLRTGWEAVLPYLETLLTGVLIPYSLGLLFILSDKRRWLAFAAFLLFTMSFMQKALFLRAVAPLFFLWAQSKVGSRSNTVISVVAATAIALPFVMTALERGDHYRLLVGMKSNFASSEMPARGPSSLPGTQVEGQPLHKRLLAYFSAGYLPEGTVDHVVWRVVAVPIFTATDSLRVFEENLDGKPLYGATSSLISGIFSLQRVPFESLVFEHQWSESEIGRSNAVYFIEAYVNFGWAGVVLLSLIVGQCLRWFWKSSDYAFKALSLLFVIQIVSSGLLGTLFSNGYVLLFLFALFCTVSPSSGANPRSKPVVAIASPVRP